MGFCGGSNDPDDDVPFVWDGYCTECFSAVHLDEGSDNPTTPREAVCHACDKALIFEEGMAVGAAIVAWAEVLQDRYYCRCAEGWSFCRVHDSCAGCQELSGQVTKLREALDEIEDGACYTPSYATNCDHECRTLARAALATPPESAIHRETDDIVHATGTITKAFPDSIRDIE